MVDYELLFVESDFCTKIRVFPNASFVIERFLMVSRIIWQDYWIKCELYLQLNAFLVCQFFIHCHTFDTTLSPTDCILELSVTGFCLFFFYWKQNAGDFPVHPVAKTLHSQWAPSMQGAQVRSLVRDLDPTCHNQDPCLSFKSCL